MPWIILGITLSVVFLGVVIYNQLIALRQMANNGWSDIDVQLKRRADLIPQLVRTVKGYAAHETKLFSDVTLARGKALAASGPGARGAAETALSKPVSRLLAMAEDYPDLKASDNFLDLQKELAETEEKVEMARRFYNGAVRELNTKIGTIPANIVAALSGFHMQEYFDIAISDAGMPLVDFSA